MHLLLKHFFGAGEGGGLLNPVFVNHFLYEGHESYEDIIEDQIVHCWGENDSIGTNLSNPGNLCFVNSALQVLAHTPCVYNCMKNERHSRKCNYNNPKNP